MKRRMRWMTATVVRTACSDLKDWRSKTMVVRAKTKGVMVRTVVVIGEVVRSVVVVKTVVAVREMKIDTGREEEEGRKRE
ncbi:hypothetical protein MtrunA17_Chr8g0362501 [Medicago truncatula]|uniref:Uncharacterized protein n=1 Tax=Medicago truncatula TaxID=3880 RepID=A0A072TQY8_MEDTR|nr:hypothetical protein MTR_8g468820 [Medicago truncatula]RHN41105.1 hypothetical protein MtrunA17_Chr8g0362501 [Medicago truncatula]